MKGVTEGRQEEKDAMLNAQHDRKAPIAHEVQLLRGERAVKRRYEGKEIARMMDWEIV